MSSRKRKWKKLGKLKISVFWGKKGKFIFKNLADSVFWRKKKYFFFKNSTGNRKKKKKTLECFFKE